MTFVFRRYRSTGASVSTKLLTTELVGRAKPTYREQLLDANQLQRLSLTLDRPQLYSDLSIKSSAPPNGTPLPPGYHLAYFTPAALPNELGSDGTDVAYTPGQPFNRRMWAGGELRWGQNNNLCVGQSVTESTHIVAAEPKRTRLGEDMIVVRVQKAFENSKGVALIDLRDWVFRAELQDPLFNEGASMLTETDVSLPEAPESALYSRDFLQTPISLFHFSALTFNAHKIHYSRPWCRTIEGHREIVVHGPLNLINMLDFWRDTRSGANRPMPKSIKYRATAPLYQGERYRAYLEDVNDGAAQVKFWGSDGKGDVRMAMMGDIEN